MLMWVIVLLMLSKCIKTCAASLETTPQSKVWKNGLLTIGGEGLRHPSSA